jgi:ACR3 family arsenite transporter
MTKEDSLLGVFERLLSLWVAIAIAVGIGLGVALPSLFQGIAQIEYASVNLVVAVLIWVMIYPMMVNVDFSKIKDVGKKPKGLCITLVVNWLIKPFTMAFLGVLFFEHIFAGLVPLETGREYIAGMILLGVAPCTAMVFVWSQLVRGDANYTLVQVSVNDLIMVFAVTALSAPCSASAWCHKHRRSMGNPFSFSSAICSNPIGSRVFHSQKN